jgi:hypothetical protein
MDYMGFHDLFDHLLTPSQKSDHTANSPEDAIVRRLASLREPVRARNRRKIDPQFGVENAKGMCGPGKAN